MEAIRKEFLTDETPKQLAQILIKSISKQEEDELKQMVSMVATLSDICDKADFEKDENGKILETLPNNIKKVHVRFQFVDVVASLPLYEGNIVNEKLKGYVKKLESRTQEEKEQFCENIKKSNTIFIAFILIMKNEKLFSEIKDFSVIKNDPTFSKLLKNLEIIDNLMQDGEP